MNDPRVKAMFKRSRCRNLFIFIFSQDYYQLPKRRVRANGTFYHIFKPDIFRDVQNLYQDKTSMDMTLNEIKYLTSTCWNGKYQPLTIDLTEDRYQGRYRLGLNSIVFPDSSPFQIIDACNYKNIYTTDILTILWVMTVSTLWMSVYSNVTEQGLINLRKLAEQQKNQRALKIKKNSKINTWFKFRRKFINSQLKN